MPTCPAAGLEGLQFKMLRTANATAVVDLAVDIPTAQIRGGHGRASTQPSETVDRAPADLPGTPLPPLPRWRPARGWAARGASWPVGGRPLR